MSATHREMSAGRSFEGVNMAGTLQSMTGFGGANGPLSARLGASVRVTTVNARFLDLVVRTHPRMETTELELALRPVLAQGLTRGRVQVTIELQAAGAGSASLELDWGVAAALVQALAQKPTGLELAPLSLRDLLALPGFAKGHDDPALTDDERQALIALVARTLDEVVAARRREAAALLQQVAAELKAVGGFQRFLVANAHGLRERLQARLRERLAALLAGRDVDEQRLVQEAALLAERADVAEETQRLAAHLAHFEQMLAQGGAVGKKLEFLLQEMLREVNTAASKCREAGDGEQVVEAKAAIERLREQCANLE
jgi:uncharacterized protein (TIGR00255 family)